MIKKTRTRAKQKEKKNGNGNIRVRVVELRGKKYYSEASKLRITGNVSKRV